ncbi:MAG TPA: SxtJ family membrane protein, partial [Blastocatellia bacterium]
VFAGLGSWWVYAGKVPAVAPVILTLGGLLILFGLLFPKALVYPNRAWMGLAEILGFIMTRVILAIVFYLLVTPIGFIKRLWGWDPLRLRADPSQSYWKSYAARQRDPRHYEKMY